MRIALLTDLHGNREALTACLAHAAERQVDRYAFLGDLVGYGADPAWVVDTVREHVQRGAIAVMGNHDMAVVGNDANQMHADANTAVEWTRVRLNGDQLGFLAQLPYAVEDLGCLFVHASAAAPEQWEYILGPPEAARSLHATSAPVTFCGHMHDPALYNMSSTGQVSVFTPRGDSSIPLPTTRRWLAIPGSVGQPRDGNPAACYAVFDTAIRDLSLFRVPYDCETAAARILMAGLPPRLAQRLLIGR